MEVMSLLIEDGFGRGPEDGFPAVKGLVPTTFGWSVIFCYPSCDEETTTPPKHTNKPENPTVNIGSCSSSSDCAQKCAAAPGGGKPAPTKRKREAQLISSSCDGGQCSCKYDQAPDISNFVPAPGGGICFTADSTVQTPSGPVRMDMLHVGQQVLVMNDATGQAVYEPVDSFIHRREDVVATFMRLETDKGAVLKLSPEHLVPVVECGTGQSSSQVRYAKDAQAGECLLVHNGEQIEQQQISAVSTTVNTGIYAPLTKSGNVLVNDVVASCYSKFEGYYVQNSFYRAFKLLLDVVGHVATPSAQPLDPPSMLYLFETLEST